MLFSQLQHSLCSAITHLPFRHPLPKLSRATFGWPFFLAVCGGKPDFFDREIRSGSNRPGRESVLNRRSRFESPHLGNETARQRRGLSAVRIDMRITDFDVGQPLFAAENPAMERKVRASEGADPRRDRDQFVESGRRVIVDFAMRFANVCTILVKIRARLPSAGCAR